MLGDGFFIVEETLDFGFFAEGGAGVEGELAAGSDARRRRCLVALLREGDRNVGLFLGGSPSLEPIGGSLIVAVVRWGGLAWAFLLILMAARGLEVDCQCLAGAGSESSGMERINNVLSWIETLSEQRLTNDKPESTASGRVTAFSGEFLLYT
ncbi:hypothetical protein L873DRAFT_1787948 [Choiromyces venosus 120613-1]|uniref:Uncharacterized protein n=1 Tax=Choiromyces venosus 120613-1 TaxID=1336337 RepID=A0A3N4JV84_9PEZI|nr:hypothetical protein L873DRAFT_1787948 [Choiromyces venosus 120613-1]